MDEEEPFIGASVDVTTEMVTITYTGDDGFQYRVHYDANLEIVQGL